MLKGVVVACACVLALPVQARAEVARVTNPVAPREALPQQTTEGETRRSAGSIILTDAIGGAALGGLAGGGGAADRDYVENGGWGHLEGGGPVGRGSGRRVGLGPG